MLGQVKIKKMKKWLGQVPASSKGKNILSFYFFKEIVFLWSLGNIRQRTQNISIKALDIQQDLLIFKIIRDFSCNRGEHCLVGGSGWWKYEFCYGKKVDQFHIEENVSYTNKLFLFFIYLYKNTKSLLIRMAQ